MPTLEELLRYKYGDSQTPDDILRQLENINLERKKNSKAIPHHSRRRQEHILL